MSKDILDKLELKNTKNLSAHTFENSNTLSGNIEDIKINDDLTNEEVLNYENGIIDGVKSNKEEEIKIKNKDDIKIDNIPILPNLSE